MNFYTPIDMKGNPVLNASLQGLASAPSSPALGNYWWRTDIGKLQVYTGSTTVTFATEEWVATQIAGASVDWSSLSGKPNEFTPAAHNHAIGDVTGLTDALAAKSDTGHSHLAANISDLASYVDGRIASNISAASGGNTALDELSEWYTKLLSNSDALTSLIKRHAETIGDGSSTSFAISHNHATKDVTVELYEIATGETVFTDVARTSNNVVTVEFATAPTTDQFRVVVLA